MRHAVWLCILLAVLPAAAETRSYAAASTLPKPAGKPVARVNGSVLTDRDLQREMFAIFPYARLHNGVPKGMEGEIRKGAMQMMIFEELVYQEALARKMTIPPAKMIHAVAEFRKQFPSDTDYRKFTKEEFSSSEELLQAKIRRSLLIEEMLQIEVTSKAAVSLADTKAYYNLHLDKFRTPESYAVQTISFIPPNNANPAQLKEARKHGENVLNQAKAAKNYDEFGLLAEKISEDDYRVMMGDHKLVDKAQLPPEILKALGTMKTGEVSNLIQVGPMYTIVRLNGHTPAGVQKFDDVKGPLRAQLEKDKTEKLRLDLRKRLQAGAKVEEL